MQRAQIPLGIDGDPVVDRREQRVFASLSKPSPLHKDQSGAGGNDGGINASIARILDQTRDIDDDDDDVTFLERLTTAPPVVPKFPLLREGDLSKFERRTIRRPVTASLAAWRDPALVDGIVWRELWWASAGHRRVVCNILAVAPVEGSQGSIPSTGEQLLRMDVDVDVVTCEVTAQGLTTAKVVSVVIGTKRQEKKPRDNDDDDDAAENAEEEAEDEEQPADAGTSAALGSADGALVKLTNHRRGGFGAAESAAEADGLSTFFVRGEKRQLEHIKAGNKVMLTVELSGAHLHLAGCPRASEGEWVIEGGAAHPEANAAADEADDVALAEGEDRLKRERKARRRGKTARKGFDVVLRFVPDPDSREAQAAARREEMKRKAKLAAKGRGGR